MGGPGVPPGYPLASASITSAASSAASRISAQPDGYRTRGIRTGDQVFAGVVPRRDPAKLAVLLREDHPGTRCGREKLEHAPRRFPGPFERMDQARPADAQARLLKRLPHGRIGGRLPGLDEAAGRDPCAFGAAVAPPKDEDAAFAQPGRRRCGWTPLLPRSHPTRERSAASGGDPSGGGRHRAGCSDRPRRPSASPRQGPPGRSRRRRSSPLRTRVRRGTSRRAR